MCSHIYANRPPEVIGPMLLGPMLFHPNIGLLRLVPGQANTPIARSRGELVHLQREPRRQPDAPGPGPR